MTVEKAVKKLQQKGTGFVFKIYEMEKNFATDIFLKAIQTHGYILRKTDDGIKVVGFKLTGEGEPIQYIDFIDTDDDYKKESEQSGWGLYSFGELFNKFNKLYLHFGMTNEIVHKEPEKIYDLYR